MTNTATMTNTAKTWPEIRPPHHPVAAKFPMMEGDAAIELRRDIADHGLIDAIVLDAPLEAGGQIVDGRNRERECFMAGKPARFEVFSPAAHGAPDVISYIIAKNLRRRHLTPSQAAMLGAELIPLYEEAAAKRREGALAKANLQRKLRARPQSAADEEAPDDVLAPLALALAPDTGGETGRARDQAAAAVGVSSRSVERAAVVKEQGAPELVDAVKAGKVTVGAASEIATLPKEEQAALASADPKEIEKRAAELRRERESERRAEREAKIRAQAAQSLPLDAGGGRFAVAYIDPPWRYDAPVSDTRKIENKYPTMTVEEICALPVPSILTDDAIVFMFVTAPLDCDGTGQRVVDAWGLRLVAKQIWAKDERESVEERGEGARRGMGRWTRVDHELLYVCVRGEPPTPEPSARFSSVLYEPRGEHSAKPERFAERIEVMYPTLPRVELFARAPRPGWAVWGNESEGKVVAPAASGEVAA